MHDFLKLHHNWDAYTGVQKERKSTFLTAFEQRGKEARSLFAAQYWYRSCLWMSLSSESSVSNKIPRYLYWSTDFTYWPPNFKTGVAVLFALLALNVIQTVLLQLKIIPFDSAYARHTSSILCNQRTLGQNTQISLANIIDHFWWTMKSERCISACLIPGASIRYPLKHRTAANICRACQMRKGYDNPGRVSF